MFATATPMISAVMALLASKAETIALFATAPTAVSTAALSAGAGGKPDRWTAGTFASNAKRPTVIVNGTPFTEIG